MFEPLPPETFALKTLLADLHDDLEGRVMRLRLLLALEDDFGAAGRLILPGGTTAFQAFVETRQAFVLGNFLSVILFSQCLIENALAAQLNIDASSAEIHGKPFAKQKGRPGFRETVSACKFSGIINEEDEADLLRLAQLRNALAHFRAIDDPSHLDRRAISERCAALTISEQDARFAITIFTRVLAKRSFRLTNNPDDDVLAPV